MRIRVTGQYTNGNPYEKCFPKEQLSQADAEAYLQALDLNEIQASDNGFQLNYDTLQAELFDDEYIEPAERTRLKIVLYDMNLLSSINQYMVNKNGKTAIWWDTVPTIDFYHPLVQEAITELNLPLETAKNIWRQAKLID